MPNRWTFTIKPVAELLSQENIVGEWYDPFAGFNSPAKYRNDLNPEANAQYNEDALVWMSSLPDSCADGVLYDPPYSFRQASECYKSVGRENFTATVTSKKYWADLKKEVARITKPGGKVICFGWNTMGIGKTRGFKMTRVLIVPHGGSMNDTLVTVEMKH